MVPSPRSHRGRKRHAPAKRATERVEPNTTRDDQDTDQFIAFTVKTILIRTQPVLNKQTVNFIVNACCGT